MNKLNEFHDAHNINEETTRSNLERAAAQLPPPEPARQHPAVHVPRKAADGDRNRGPSARRQPAADARRDPGPCGPGTRSQAPQLDPPRSPQESRR